VEMGAAGRRAAEAHWGWAGTTRRTLGLLRDIMTESQVERT